jgi:hypothetical protein
MPFDLVWKKVQGRSSSAAAGQNSRLALKAETPKRPFANRRQMHAPCQSSCGSLCKAPDKVKLAAARGCKPETIINPAAEPQRVRIKLEGIPFDRFAP